MKKIILSAIITTIIVVVLLRKIQVEPFFVLERQQRIMMTTYVTVYAHGTKPAVSVAIDHAFQRMQEVAEKFNAHNPKSPVYAFNQNGTPIKDEEILKVVKKALDIAKESSGAFDITVYPLVKLWGFYGENLFQVPTQEEISKAMKKVGYQHLIFTDTELKADKNNIFIDLGGIAKGYVIIQGIEVLKTSGIKSAIIQAGGDTYCLGYKDKKPWRIGIAHPRNNGLLGYIRVADQAIMGSGDYERFFVNQGRRYHHIIDPRTGYPAKETSGVTVIYSDPVAADAWATALSVLGTKGLKIIEKTPGMEVVMVTNTGEILYTPGLKGCLSKN